jgi:hypothetical protein
MVDVNLRSSTWCKSILLLYMKHRVRLSCVFLTLVSVQIEKINDSE